MNSETVEKYVETIHELEQTKAKAKNKDIASKLNVKQPSVTEMLQKLEQQGLADYEPYQGATLTDAGKQLAHQLSEKHSILAKFLKAIGVDAEIAEDDACKIEHIMHNETIKQLKTFVTFLERQQNKTKWIQKYRSFSDKITSEEIQNKNKF